MGKHGMSIIDRLMERTLVVDDPWSCWFWTGPPTSYGYGRLRVGDTMRVVHVLMYEEMVGPIPECWDVDHLCHNKAAALGLCNEHPCPHQLCVRPDHLEAKPHGDNLGASPLTQAAINKAKTECTRGHPFDEENTGYKKETGWRYCRECNRLGTKGRAEWDAAHKQGEQNGIHSEG